jgi:pyruvate/2-oxoglutarate dehydrogenase complex dihydrolipoamide dehydrogenase (E3) component
MNNQFDVIWIGTGQSTLSIIPRIVKAGKTVAVIESGDFGGTCVNTGCTPTKKLVAAARAIFQAQRGADFGFSVSQLEIDFEQVMAPQKEGRASASQWIEQHLTQFENCTVFNGEAQFVDSHTIEVNGEQQHGEHIVISAGARPRVPEVKGIENIEFLTNENLLDLTELPQHIVIVGGSYIGLEFAQIFRRLGSKVTVLEYDSQLMFREDVDVADIAEDILKSESVDIICRSQVESVSVQSSVSSEQKIAIHYRQHEQQHQLNASHILFATGRQPNSDRLNLSVADIDVNSHGFIQVNDTMQTTQPHVYAVGDINGHGAFTHTSVNDGEIFWDQYSRLLGINDEATNLDRTLSMRNVPYAMFIDPPLARIGIGEKQARQSDRKILMATMPMSQIARAKEKKETYGVVKIFVDAETEEIVGATVFGTGGDEIIGVFAAFMQTKSTYKIFRRTVFPHPTVGELLPWILDNLEPIT